MFAKCRVRNNIILFGVLFEAGRSPFVFVLVGVRTESQPLVLFDVLFGARCEFNCVFADLFCSAIGRDVLFVVLFVVLFGAPKHGAVRVERRASSGAR